MKTNLDARKRMINRLLRQDNGDNGDIQWITTDTGTHVPLKDGVAVGGGNEG